MSELVGVDAHRRHRLEIERDRRHGALARPRAAPSRAPSRGPRRRRLPGTAAARRSRGAKPRTRRTPSATRHAASSAWTRSRAASWSPTRSRTAASRPRTTARRLAMSPSGAAPASGPTIGGGSRVGRRLVRGPSRLGVEARVPERDGCRPREDAATARCRRAARFRARAAAISRLVHRERQHGSWRRAQASSELRRPAGRPRPATTGSRVSATAATVGEPAGAVAPSGSPTPPARTNPSPSGHRTAAASAPSRALAAMATAAAARDGSRLSKSAVGTASSRGPVGPGLEALAEPGRRDDAARRSCRARTGPVAGARPGARRAAGPRDPGTGMARAAPRPCCSRRASGAAETAASLHHLVGGERAADDPFARADLEREAEATLRHHDQSGVAHRAG